MQGRADAKELLRQARLTLLKDLRPELPAEYRYLGSLIANAMAIATRELEAGPCDRREYCQELGKLMDDEILEDDVESLAEVVFRREWRVVGEIRAGHHDGTKNLHDILFAAAQAELRRVSPKTLENAAD